MCVRQLAFRKLPERLVFYAGICEKAGVVYLWLYLIKFQNNESQ